MPPPHPALPKAAAPRHAAAFDPWNSSSTGHQRADQRADPTRRDARARSLNHQFRARRVASPEALGPPARSVADLLTRPGLMRATLDQQQRGSDKTVDALPLGQETGTQDPGSEGRQRGIFDGVVVYVNGSTYPLVSDHKLKHLLSENGAQMALHLGRRRVTHVILGRPAGGGRGAGGGLAGGKLDREIKKAGGCGVRFVGVEWVLESLKTGKRLPEARFSNLKMASAGQDSVYGRFAAHAAAGSPT